MTTLLIPPPRYRDHILSTLTLETLVILLLIFEGTVDYYNQVFIPNSGHINRIALHIKAYLHYLTMCCPKWLTRKEGNGK